MSLWGLGFDFIEQPAAHVVFQMAELHEYRDTAQESSMPLSYQAHSQAMVKVGVQDSRILGHSPD